MNHAAIVEYARDKLIRRLEIIANADAWIRNLGFDDVDGQLWEMGHSDTDSDGWVNSHLPDSFR